MFEKDGELKLYLERIMTLERGKIVSVIRGSFNKNIEHYSHAIFYGRLKDNINHIF